MPYEIFVGDCIDLMRTALADESVHCCVTSPPYYGLRDYQIAGQIGLEASPQAYVERMVEVFREVRRVLRKDGTVFLNLGDSYFGGGRGGNPIESPHQKQRTNRGSVSMPASVRHGAACGMPGKALEDSQAHDCFCRNLCGACRAAYQIGKSHSAHQPVATPPVSNSVSSRERKVSLSGHLPKLGSVGRGARSATAIHDQQQEPGLVDGRHSASPESKPAESSRQHQGENRQLGRPSGCQLCGCSLPDCALASAHTGACTCGTTVDVSAGRKTDRDVSGLAHRDYTTAPLKPKDLIGIPWRVAFALQADGWYLRQDIIWAKPNPMPESVRDRCTKAHEYIFLLSKSPRYYFDAAAIAEPAVRSAAGSKFNTGKTAEHQLGRASDKPRKQDQVGKRTYTGFNALYKESGPVEMRNKRDVWTVPTRGFKGAHFATFPPALIEPCILAGCPEGGTVLDPFGGAGTTALVAMKHKRNAILLELKPEYAEIARKRLE